MSDDRYRFKLGNFECLAILDNTYTTTANFMFSNVPPEVSHPILKQRDIDPDSIVSPYNCLAVNTGREWILIDTGVGDLQDGSRLLEILEDEEIRPHHIIITHAHIDHFGGLISRDGHLNFPNAQVYMCRDEWAVFTSRDYLQKHPDAEPAIRQHLLPAEVQIERVECIGEILPGFSILDLPGHTPHHIGIVIESRDQELIFCADALPHSLLIDNLDWQYGYDADPELGMLTRSGLAEIASDHGSLVMASHVEFPGLGYIRKQGHSYRWQALAT